MSTVPLRGPQHPASFEIEVSTLEEFLGLLEKREYDPAVTLPNLDSVPRRAVWTCALLDYRTGQHGVPVVKRHVQAAITYGADVITYRRTISCEMEIADMSEKFAQKQREAHTKLRERIEREIERIGPIGAVPLVEGSPGCTQPRR